MDKRQISDNRKMIFYGGIALQAIGGLFFVGNIIFGAIAPVRMPSFEDGAPNPYARTIVVAILGMGMMLVGGLMTVVGRVGLAGAGFILDPKQARKDVEPWSRMSGGILADTLDEAKIDLSGQPDLPFDDRLRRLEQLRKDGLVTEAEYAETRARIIKDA